MTSHTWYARVFLTAVGLTAWSSTARGSAYDVVPLPAGVSSAWGVNASGDVTGTSTSGTAFRLVGAVQTNLPDLGQGGFGNVINDAGQVAGSATVGIDRVAMRWTGNTAENLGTLGGGYSDLRGINSSGHVVGGSYTTNDQAFRPILWLGPGTGLVDLGTFGGYYSAAEGINDAGQVAGWSDYTTTASRRAFLYQNGAMQDLGTLGGASWAFDINNNARVVGGSEAPNGRDHGFVWIGGVMHDLGALPNGNSYATAINENDQIVGNGTGNTGERALLFRPIGPMDLNRLVPAGTPTLQRANDIGDDGTIVGLALNNAAFRLEPNPLVLSVPSPGTVGVQNTFLVSDSNPGSRVHVLYSTRTGTFDLEDWCYGEQLGLRTPTLVGNAVADPNGATEVLSVTPVQASGVTVYYQAIELDSCRVSNRVTYTWP